MYVVALASEDRVGLYVDTNEEVAVRTAVYAAVALTAYAECLSVVDTCWDVDGNVLLYSDSAYAAALRTRLLIILPLPPQCGHGFVEDIAPNGVR